MCDSGAEAEYQAELTYPLDYTFKIIGLASDDFAEYARKLVERVVGQAPADRVEVRPSKQGKYHSVTVVARLESDDERRAVYQVLNGDERVFYVL